MAISLKEKIERLKSKGVLATALIIGISLVIIEMCSNPTETIPRSLTARRKARIDSVQAVTQMRQSRYGTQIFTGSYRIRFVYEVSGVTYRQTDEINNLGRNQPLISKIINSRVDSIDIVYDPSDPNESKIDRNAH